MKKTYTIDFLNNTITVTAAFLKKASKLGSKEYTEMVKLRTEHPNFKFEKMEEETKKEPKKRASGLTLEFMEVYVEETFGKESAEMKAFFNANDVSKKQGSGRYSYMLKWFKQTCPSASGILCEKTDEAAVAAERREKARAKIAAHQTLQTATEFKKAEKAEAGFAFASGDK